MASAQQKMTLDFLFSSNNAEVVRRNGRNTNVIKIGGVSYRYRRDMPITQRLKTKLSKVRKTMHGLAEVSTRPSRTKRQLLVVISCVISYHMSNIQVQAGS